MEIDREELVEDIYKGLGGEGGVDLAPEKPERVSHDTARTARVQRMCTAWHSISMGLGGEGGMNLPMHS